MMLVIWLPSSDSVIVGPPLRLRSMVTAAAVAGSALPLGSDGPGGWWWCLPTTRMCIWCQQRQAGRQAAEDRPGQCDYRCQPNRLISFMYYIMPLPFVDAKLHTTKDVVAKTRPIWDGIISQTPTSHPASHNTPHIMLQLPAFTNSLSFAEIIAIVIVVKLSRAQLGREEEE